jgi:hypothetical protein
VVIVDADVGIINPLIYRNIINDGILKGDAALIVRLAVRASVQTLTKSSTASSRESCRLKNQSLGSAPRRVREN